MVIPTRQHEFRVNSTTTLIRACEAGLGLALLPCLAADRCRLTRLSEQPEQLRELWLLGHRDATRIRRFQVVGDWLANALKAESEKLAGTRLP